MPQVATRPLEAANETLNVEAIREEAFRAGYGMGGDAAQRESRRRSFMLEDEAWNNWRRNRR